MTEQTTPSGPTQGHSDTQKPIVVAVDGSDKNRSAVVWAAAEAAAIGSPVVLVTVIDDHLRAIPRLSIKGHNRRALEMLDGLREEFGPRPDPDSIRTEVVVGSAVQVLLDRSEQARLLVVGKRGLGGFTRALVGSTSIAVAGRATSPVVLVPHSWKVADHAEAPLVLGIDPYRPERAQIRFAFERARSRGLGLVAVHGWETPTAYSWDEAVITGAMTTWEQEAATEFDRVLDDWCGRYADVDVVAVHSHSHPATAILDAAEDAQLVVLGRHSHHHRLAGFAFGSVTRAVLHYSECPVVVIPSDED